MQEEKREQVKWYVRDFRASTMRRLGWVGPSIDRILITNQTGPEMEASSGENCVVARIQFDNRPEELTESNFEDALLMAAAPALLQALRDIVDFCDDPDGSENGERLAMGMGRLLPAARIAIASTANPD